MTATRRCRSRVSLYVPEAKGKPARVNIYQYPGDATRPLNGKSFYKAQEVKKDPRVVAPLTRARRRAPHVSLSVALLAPR